MNKTEEFKVYSYEEATDFIFGVDTPERKDYEEYLADEMRKEEERKHRVSIPGTLYIKLRQMAAETGQSVTSYVQQALSSIVSSVSYAK